MRAVAKHKPKRKGYATGGSVLIPRSGKTDAWIDNIPIDQLDERATPGDRRLEIKPKSPNDDMVTMPQPPGTPRYMENSKGGKVKRVLKRRR